MQLGDFSLVRNTKLTHIYKSAIKFLLRAVTALPQSQSPHGGPSKALFEQLMLATFRCRGPALACHS